ncbi:MAG TPA: C40 family peptidase [Cytophagales bacterium]|nr:C40 family peptidase [Cytophagales bacterium]
MYLKFLVYSLFVCILLSCKSAAPKTSHRAKYEPPRVNSAGHATHPAVKKARTYLGTPYKYCGLDHHGIDCSGLVYVSFKEMHIDLPRMANDQSKRGKRVYIGELSEGDLVFFKEKKNGSSKKITHVGIISSSNYPNSVTFIHSSTSKGVREDELMSGYWKDLYVMAVRIDG